MKKYALFSLGLALFLAPCAYAEDASGTITAINEATNTFVLDGKQTYTLPGEFDYSVLHTGMRVLVFYDVQNEQRYVNDIEPQDN